MVIIQSSITIQSPSDTSITLPESKTSSGPSIKTNPSSSNRRLLLGLGLSSNLRLFLPEKRPGVVFNFLGVGSRSSTPSSSSSGKGRLMDVLGGVTGVGMGFTLGTGRGKGAGIIKGGSDMG